MQTHVPKLKILYSSGESARMVITFYAVILIFTFLSFNFVNAQSSPQFLISWKAGNYAPAWYGGKVLPVAGTPVNISFELINAGKIINLSQNIVRWYINEDLVKNENDGLGIKSLRVAVPKGSNDEMSVRIVITDYAAYILDKTIIIPVVRPEVIIDSPYPNNNIQTGLSVFRAIPLFFNVSGVDKMTVSWSANGVKSSGADGNPWQLDLNLNNQSQSAIKINLSVSVKNLLNYLEFAGQNIILEMK